MLGRKFPSIRPATCTNICMLSAVWALAVFSCLIRLRGTKIPTFEQPLAAGDTLPQYDLRARARSLGCSTYVRIGIRVIFHGLSRTQTCSLSETFVAIHRFFLAAPQPAARVPFPLIVGHRTRLVSTSAVQPIKNTFARQASRATHISQNRHAP